MESQLWNEVNWRTKYVGVIPHTSREVCVCVCVCVGGWVGGCAGTSDDTDSLSLPPSLPPSLSLSLSEQLCGVGTAANVQQMSAWSHPSPHYSLVIVGLCRFRVEEGNPLPRGPCHAAGLQTLGRCAHACTGRAGKSLNVHVHACTLYIIECGLRYMGFFLLLSFYLLVCYTHYIYMYIYFMYVYTCT